MKSSLECVPCLMRQALESAAAAQKLRRMLRWKTGDADHYREAKDRFNAMAVELLPEFLEKISRSEDPFAAAVRLAIAGNVIDLGGKGDLTECEAFDAVGRAFDEDITGDIGEIGESEAGRYVR